MPIHRHKRNEKNLLLIPGTPAPRGSQSVSHFTCGGAQIRPQPLLIALILNRPRWGWVIGLRADRFFAYHHSCRSPVSSLKRKGSAEESTNHGFPVKPLSRTLNRPRGERWETFLNIIHSLRRRHVKINANYCVTGSGSGDMVVVLSMY